LGADTQEFQHGFFLRSRLAPDDRQLRVLPLGGLKTAEEECAEKSRARIVIEKREANRPAAG
jgi:hypothetical protein